VVPFEGSSHLKSNIALPLVIAGIVESGAESMLFSMGNPGSVAIPSRSLILGERSREETVRNERGYADRPVRSIVNRSTECRQPAGGLNRDRIVREVARGFTN